jgi:hypothetical protein
MSLNGELRRSTGALARLGWVLTKGGRSGPNGAQEFQVLPLRPGVPENPGEISGPAAE